MKMLEIKTMAHRYATVKYGIWENGRICVLSAICRGHYLILAHHDQLFDSPMSSLTRDDFYDFLSYCETARPNYS